MSANDLCKDIRQRLVSQNCLVRLIHCMVNNHQRKLSLASLAFKIFNTEFDFVIMGLLRLDMMAMTEQRKRRPRKYASVIEFSFNVGNNIQRFIVLKSIENLLTVLFH